jgi:Methyltransferase domain
MKCIICGCDTEYLFSGEILKKYEVKYFLCRNCSHIQTEKPYWLNEAYRNSITSNDSGIMGRNTNFVNRVSTCLWWAFNRNGIYLDWAGGYGIFVRMMRDIGFDFYWSDLYSENLFAKDFEFDNSDAIEMVTCFEVFEHLENPVEQIEKLLAISDNLLISTELFDAKKIPQLDQWYYYAPEHGQHISFFSIETLRYIASKYNLTLISNNFNMHLFSKRNIKHKLLLKFFMKAHRLLVLPFSEYIKIRMAPKTLADSKLFNK